MATPLNPLPAGTVTFLFTDIEGSTKLWESHPEAMRTALARHDAILRQVIETQNGHVIKSTGDGVHAVFGTALDGAYAAINAQQALGTAGWDEVKPQAVRVRIGLHTGEAEVRGGDYYGATLNRAARLMAIGHGGQILLSNTSAELVRDQLPDGAILLDLGEQRLKDLVRPEHVFQLTSPGLPADFPPLKSLDAFPHNLPVQLTSFVGREHELEEARKRLASARLLTLIGPGGTGKTRLALQLAAELMPAFSDGVWLIDLAPLTDPALVLQTVASVFGVREQMGMPLKDLVVDYLRAKNVLLLLDNCEHLVEICAHLADELLHACLKLKIVASSREALGIAGETIYRVPSLSLPLTDQVSMEALASCESVQLFLERAVAANPRFTLNEGNASAIAQICRRLDGIPLALELAAARVTVFSPEQIASRLDDRFRLLTGGSRTALPRQQTLRALIDWSYDMLSEPEQALMRRLSVFAGGWTYEAAEAIGSDMDVLNLLTQLINKSLVAVEEENDRDRYRLLETVRQYARDKLLETGEAETARDTHLRYFHQFVQEAGPKADLSQDPTWMRRLEEEHDNLRVALEWGLQKNLDAVLEMGWNLAPFWTRRGHEVEGRYWLTEAITRTETLPKPEGEADAQRTSRLAYASEALAMVEFSQGDNLHAMAHSGRAARLARELGDKHLLSLALGFEVSSDSLLGGVKGTDVLAEEAIAAAHESQDAFSKGIALVMSGQVLRRVNEGDGRAHALINEGLANLQKSGHRWGYTMAVFSLGISARYKGDFDEARLRFAACDSLFREMGDMHRTNMIKSELAHCERAQGHLQLAEAMYRETILEWQRIGHRAAVAHQLECFAVLAMAQEQDRQAACLFGAAEALRERIEIPMTAQEHEEYEREVANLRAGMDENIFNAAWAQGRSLSMEQAIEFAVKKME